MKKFWIRWNICCQLLFSIFLIVWIWIHKVSEFRSQLDPDPQHCCQRKHSQLANSQSGRYLVSVGTGIRSATRFEWLARRSPPITCFPNKKNSYFAAAVPEVTAGPQVGDDVIRLGQGSCQVSRAQLLQLLLQPAHLIQTTQLNTHTLVNNNNNNRSAGLSCSSCCCCSPRTWSRLPSSSHTDSS